MNREDYRIEMIKACIQERDICLRLMAMNDTEGDIEIYCDARKRLKEFELRLDVLLPHIDDIKLNIELDRLRRPPGGDSK